MTHSWIPVVAGAMRRDDGRWLMHKRPEEKHHGGLWEFPGGKVEPHETPVESLVRELREELGIAVSAPNCRPATFAQETGQDSENPIVILLYIVDRWEGEPTPLEGGGIDWFTPHEVAKLSKPPLDVILADALFKAG